MQPSKVQLKHSHWVPDGVCVVDNLKLVSMTFLRVAMCRRCVAGVSVASATAGLC